MTKASIIIGFYKRFDQLELIFEALKKQAETAFEVIIADDGSPQEVVDKIQLYSKKSDLIIKHIWHEDKGFRKTTVLNKAVLAAESPYLIFIDGDCIPDKYFIADHLKYKKTHRMVNGRRVELSEFLSQKVNVEFIKKGNLQPLKYVALWDSFFGKTRKAEVGFRVNSKSLNEKYGSFKKGILGCNFSIHKADVIELNGFDERYEHPGVGEDTELEKRARHAGFEIFKPKLALVQYHLWHKKQSRAFEKENLVLLKETIDNKYIKTPYGINSL
ncbi:hypothetical protein GCM10027429_09540 [Marivirga atlantica]|jgi:glycosyltransferase involved in cell wall biosynthesis|uniref:Glycosyltransferase n=1 Tax=Marivirga atlantica TaxID=1548457 RepID=A0A937ADA1_9BACT|nr:glycosyltransferase [Marivirga atlantica]MBL0764566.1 glycosyltransferase [Marivirga atlantica]